MGGVPGAAGWTTEMRQVGATTGRLLKYLSLSRAEQGLLAEAAVALGAIRFGLRLLPARRVREITARVARWTATGGRQLHPNPCRPGGCEG